MNWLFSRSTVVWLMMTSGCAVAQSGKEFRTAIDTVNVTVQSGRQFVAEIDARTNDDTLWLRYGTINTTLLRPIHWSRVVIAQRRGEILGKADLIALARDAKFRSQTSEVSSLETQLALDFSRNASQLSDADRARRVLGSASGVRDVEVEASLGNWDSEVDADGLVVAITPLDELGQPVDINGMLYVTLTSPQCENTSRVAQGERIGPIGQWTVTLDSENWNKQSYVVRLPFRAAYPEPDTSVAAHSMVHVRLVVPGHGSFDRTVRPQRN